MYQALVKEFSQNPRDVHTVPIEKGRNPLWFRVAADARSVYVESARAHTPSCRIYGRRTLNESEYGTLLDLYHRRQRGEHVSPEATRATVNQVYWYGIFAELGY